MRPTATRPGRHARATQGCYLKMDGLATDTIEHERLVFELTPACRPGPLTRVGECMETVPFGHSLSAALAATRHDFVFAAASTP
jgi:hypothetical protein